MATVVDLSGATYPTEFKDYKILLIDGIPLTPAFDGKLLGRKQLIFIEHENTAFVRDGEWKLVGRGVSMPRGLQKDKWQLYHLSEDGTELTDLAKEMPDKVKAMSDQWQAWAERAQCFTPKPRPNPPAAGQGKGQQKQGQQGKKQEEEP